LGLGRGNRSGQMKERLILSFLQRVIGCIISTGLQNGINSRAGLGFLILAESENG